MIRLRHKFLILTLRVVDQAVMVGTLLLVLELIGASPSGRSLQQVLTDAHRPHDLTGIVLLAVGWIVMFSIFVTYEPHRFTSLRKELGDVAKATAASSFLLMLVATSYGFGRVNNRVVLIVWVGATVLGWITRIAARRLLPIVRGSRYSKRHLLIVGANDDARQMAARVSAVPELGYKVVGFVAESPEFADRSDVVGPIEDLQAVLERGTVDEIIICLQLKEHMPAMLDIVRLAQELGVVVRLFPDSASARVLSRAHVEDFEGAPVVTFFREQLILQLFAKRLLDFSVSLLLLILLSPLLVTIAVAIRLGSPGPVLFVQKRVGMNKREFNLLKFRSMYIDAEKRRKELEHLNEMDGPVFKIKNDPRITPLGRFIRKTSIDELPQLVNVLLGQMSLVGPRPPLPSEVDRYDWLYRKRLSIKPGITCFWQISGRNHITFKQWMEMDQYYIDNWSLWMDIKILSKTIPAVVFTRGAS